MGSTAPAKTRLLSLDALRGFDMFWIIGGDAFFRSLAEVTNWGWAKSWAVQLEHVEWAGFHFYDLIFPLFMFISGVAIPLSLLAKAETAADKRPITIKLVKRALLLVLLGFVYNHLTDLQFASQRYASVLGQIGLAYLFAALIMLNVRSLKGRLAALAGILAGYAAVQLLVPVPGIGAGILTPEGTINGWVDRLLLPGRLYDKIFDPEGILCILSATSVTLMGGLAGLVLRSERLAAYRKTLILAASGVGLTITGYVLGGLLPDHQEGLDVDFRHLCGGAFVHPAGPFLPDRRCLGPPEMVVLLPGHRPELDHDLSGDANDRFRLFEQVPGSAGWPGFRGRPASSCSGPGPSPSNGWSSISSIRKKSSCASRRRQAYRARPPGGRCSARNFVNIV